MGKPFTYCSKRVYIDLDETLLQDENQPILQRTIIANFFSRIAKYSYTNAGNIIALHLFSALCSLLLAFYCLTFDTDPGKMISPDLPFRQDFFVFQQAFPIFDNAFLIVVESDHSICDKADTAGRPHTGAIFQEQRKIIMLYQIIKMTLPYCFQFCSSQYFRRVQPTRKL